MNNLKNIFGLHVSRNVCSKSTQGIHQGENVFKNKYLRSKSLKNVKSDPFLKSAKPKEKKFESNLVKASNKTKTIYGGSKKSSSSLERSNSLDSLSHINNGYNTTHQVVGFKNCMRNQFNRVNNEKNIKPSSSSTPSKEAKITKQNLLNQEARSYAKLIANYSRAMENDSIYTKSFDQNYGRSSTSISDSPFNSLVPPLSKMKKKETKSGSILNTRNSSSSSPKYRDIHGKIGKRYSLYSTDSGTCKEIAKTDDIIVTNAQNAKVNKEQEAPKSEFKLEAEDVLDSVTARADWLDKVIKAHKELKSKNMIQNSNYATSKAPEAKLKIEQDPNKDCNNSKRIPLPQIDPECPIESSFKPIIDSYASPTAEKSNVDQNNLTESKVKLSKTTFDQPTKIIDKKPNVEKEITPKKTDEPKKSRSSSTGRNFSKFLPGSGGNSDYGNINDPSISPLNCINFRINGKSSSDFVTDNKSIKIVKSLEKIEIRIPISALFPERKNDEDQVQKLGKSESTLSLSISAKIETPEEQKSDDKFLNDPQKVEPKLEIISLSPESGKASKIETGITSQKDENPSDINKIASPKKASEAAVSVAAKKPISQNSETPSTECVKESLATTKIEGKEKIDDNLTKEIAAKNAAEANRAKIRKRKKTMISRVIDNELEKQNEQVHCEEKITTPLTTETKKNPSDVEAVKPETMRPDRELRTIDKVTRTTDAVIDQNVAKKLNDNVTPVGGKEIDKKTLGPTPLASLKTKLKNPSEELSAKKTIDANADKYTATKEPTKIHLTAKSHTIDHTRQRIINIDSQSVSKDPLKSRIDNKVESRKEIVKTRRDLKKDIPQELKPLEKKKDGTLIDYGLKVATRKNHDTIKVSKEPPIKATIKEILTVNEKKPSDQFQLSSKKAETINDPKMSDLRRSEMIGEQKPKTITGNLATKVTSVANFESLSPNEEFEQKAKLVDFKMVLKLQDFEENHIFSGSSTRLESTDFKKAGVLKSSTSARTDKKDTAVKPDNKGSHAKPAGSSVIIDRATVAVQIDDCSRNHQSTRKKSMKLFSNGTRSASHIERLLKIAATNKSSYSEKSNSIRSASLLKDRWQHTEKELLYSNWLQKYNKAKTISID